VKYGQQWFLAGLGVLFLVTSFAYDAKVRKPRNGETSRSAIVRWQNQLLSLDSGENIYERHTYPNPPIMAIMLRPLADMSPLAAARLWYWLKVAFTLASFYFAFRLAEDAGYPFPPWAKALTVALSMRPIIGDLMHGNVNILILFLVLGGLMLYRLGRDFAAGVTIALAVACKVTPALFIPYFVWKRAWMTLAGLAVGLGLFFFVVPGAVLGWSDNWELLRSWFNQMVWPYLAGGVVTSEHPNQSLPGLVARLFTNAPSFTEFQVDKYVPTAFHTIVDLGPAAKWIVKGVMALFCVMVVLLFRTPTDKPRTRSGIGAECALIMLGMLLFSERTWKHHAVTLLLPFAVLSYQLAMTRSVRLRVSIASILAVSFGLMAATSTGLLPDEWAKLAQVYGAYTISFFLLGLGVAAVLTCGPRASAAGSLGDTNDAMSFAA
jgi:hypothetical protein